MNDLNKVGVINIKSKEGYYQLSSVYISLEKDEEQETNNINKDNIIKDINNDYLSLLHYELIDEENIYFYFKKSKEMLEDDFKKNDEFIFPEPFIITIHIHDMKLVDGSQLNTYYVITLISEKLIKDSNEKNYSINFKKLENGSDKNFIFSKSKNGSNSYNIFHKKEEKYWISNYIIIFFIIYYFLKITGFFISI